MKKLKAWQIVLLVIFYPVGLVYLVVWLCKRNKQPTAPSAAPAGAANIDVNKLVVERDFHTKVVGVTFNNDDGTSRQAIIESCKPGEDIILKPVPTKEYPDAIGVFNKKGQQLGHLGAELASEIKTKWGHNPMSITIAALTGGGDRAYGCNLHIIIYQKQ